MSLKMTNVKNSHLSITSGQVLYTSTCKHCLAVLGENMDQDDLFKLINNIPEKNKQKFVFDLMYLLHLAQGDNYEDFDISER